jgi:hypothetical protein
VQTTTDLLGAAGLAWLDRLPAILGACEQRWLPPHTLTATFLGATNPADGCLAIQPVPSGAGTQTAYYLYRFGRLVAVNDVAQRQQSLWSPASAHERQLATAILSGGTPWP